MTKTIEARILELKAELADLEERILTARTQQDHDDLVDMAQDTWELILAYEDRIL